ncbi:MAG: tRNA pseudouridine(13) synthase TruD, partial [Nanoarchaeota archaeon]|nr:tRNA pseudouridine(13) synthase TruD [Nanoarchaeota archaeon]
KTIGYAGTKDRHAVTEQYISIKGSNVRKLKDFKADRIEIEFLGFSNAPICLGELDGNHFEVAVRNLDDESSSEALDNFEREPYIPNYFDEQRFSTNNCEAGRAIVKRDFKKAAELISKTNSDVSFYLKQNPTDFIGAIRRLPKKILLMYLHAYQSFLFNQVLGEYIKANSDDYKEVDYSLGKFIFPRDLVDNTEVPIVGFDTDNRFSVSEYVDEIIEKENISRRSFIIRELPELTCSGDIRDAFVDVDEFSYEFSDDDLNAGKKKCILKFKLQKGSYATIVVKGLFG